MKKNLLFAALLGASALIARADTVWDWSFGTESGQFVMAGSSYAPGTYTLVDFSVTSSAVGATIGSLSGGAYQTGGAAFSTNQPFTFDWDGSSVTGWHHTGPNSFSWWAFDDIPGAGKVFFGWDLGNINDPAMGAYWLHNSGPSGAPARGRISVSAAAAVPEAGSSLALLFAAMTVVGFLKRRVA